MYQWANDFVIVVVSDKAIAIMWELVQYGSVKRKQTVNEICAP